MEADTQKEEEGVVHCSTKMRTNEIFKSEMEKALDSNHGYFPL